MSDGGAGNMNIGEEMEKHFGGTNWAN